MIYYCLSDIHGCLSAFLTALNEITDHLKESDTRLVLLGDYVHGGEDNFGVLDKIIELQTRYGSDKVIALMGNHEEFAISGNWEIEGREFLSDEKYEHYLYWMSNLPLYYTDENLIFVHAGIDEEAGEMWEDNTDDFTFTDKFPAQTGFFFEDYIIIAGHVSTAEVAGNKTFCGIYFDGQSHIYIDSGIFDSGFLNILKIDTDTRKFYEVSAYGEVEVLPYDEIRDDF